MVTVQGGALSQDTESSRVRTDKRQAGDDVRSASETLFLLGRARSRQRASSRCVHPSGSSSVSCIALIPDQPIMSARFARQALTLARSTVARPAVASRAVRTAAPRWAAVSAVKSFSTSSIRLGGGQSKCIAAYFLHRTDSQHRFLQPTPLSPLNSPKSSPTSRTPRRRSQVVNPNGSRSSRATESGESATRSARTKLPSRGNLEMKSTGPHTTAAWWNQGY